MVRIGAKAEVGSGAPLLFILGPCVIESEAHAVEMGFRIAGAARATGAQVVFKASFDKANRSSIRGFRGPGLEAGLKILDRVRAETGLPVTSDIHESGHAAEAGAVLDLLQIPALLCRQTDLLLAAGRTGKPVNVKKGQFMAPEDMKHAVEKVKSTGNSAVVLTERGTSFGYRNLVVDMRGLSIMRRLGAPVIFDATHSVQLPAAGPGCSSGEPEFIPILSRAAAAAGVDGFFFEVHDRPDAALCDGPNALRLDALEDLITTLVLVDALARGGEPGVPSPPGRQP